MAKNGTTSRFKRDFKRARQQQLEQERTKVLKAIGPEAAKESLARKHNDGDFRGQEIREEKRGPKRSESKKTVEKDRKRGHKRHVSAKVAHAATAIEDLSSRMPQGQAIRAVDAKRGSRARHRHLEI